MALEHGFVGVGIFMVLLYLIFFGVLIYIITLFVRLVKAVEKIASKLTGQ